jgi:hypothetical protein
MRPFHALPGGFALIGAALLLTGCEFDIDDFGPSDRYQSDFHYTYDLQPGARLSMENGNGSIEISGWDQNRIEITGVKYGPTEIIRDEIKVEIDHRPDAVSIRTMRPSLHQGGGGARYVIHVPRKTTLDPVQTSNGRIRVDDMNSPVRLRTSNGSIRAGHVEGTFEARTSNGAIEVESVRGDAVMHTSNGHIRAENISGKCEAESSNGPIRITLSESNTSPVHLDTSNGGIDLTMIRPPKADVRAETTNSSITVRLPENTAARVMADGRRNNVSTDFNINSKFGDRDRLDGQIGAGGPTIDLRTHNGSIRILKSGSGV